MFKTTDISGVTNYVSGTALMPHDTAANFSDSETSDAGMDAADTTDVSGLLEDSVIARYRWDRTSFDMRDDIVGTWHGIRRESFTVGRYWRFNWGQFSPRIDEGLGWGDTPIAVVPAVAGLATREVDKGSIGAWGQLHHIFAVAGQPGPIDQELMAALSRHHGGGCNTVRFVHRLAALYWHTVTGSGAPGQAGQDAGRSCRLELRRPATASTVGSVNVLKANLADAMAGKQFVPWNEPGSVDSATVHKVLFAAAAGKVVAQGEQGSRFLKCWPSLGASVEVLVDTPQQANGLRALHYVELTPDEVWYAAVRWVARYSDMAHWDEAIKFLGPFCASPCARQFTTLDSRPAYCLPRSAMGTLCLGPLLEPNLDYSLGEAQRQPKHGLLVESACVRGLVYSLLHWALQFKVVGWFAMYGLCNDAEAREYMRRFSRTTHVSGAWRVINHNVGTWMPGSPGRIWGTVIGRRNDPWKKLASLNNVAPQWDELLARSKMVIPEAAIYGCIYPLRPTRETLPFRRWVGVGTIPGGRSLSHAFYSMLKAGPTIVIRTDDPGSGSRTVGHRSLRSYRGEEADFSVMKGHDRDGNPFEPVFCVTDRERYTMLVDPDGLDYQFRWWRERPEDSKVMPKSLVDITITTPAAPAPPAPPSDSDSDHAGSADDSSDGESDIDGPEDPDEETKQPERAFEAPTGYAPGEAALRALIETANRPDWRNVPHEEYQVAYKTSMLSKRLGAGDELLQALSQCIINGAPGPGQAAPHFDVILNAEHFERLSKVPYTQRQVVCEDLETLYRAVLRTTPPGSSSTQVARKAMGVHAIATAMRVSPALTIDELREHVSPKTLADMGVLKRAAGTRDELHPGYVINPDARLPEPNAIKAALEGGWSMMDAIGTAAAAASGRSLGDAPAEQATIAELCNVILDSAVMAGDVPTVDNIADIVGDAYTAQTMFDAWSAAHGILEHAELTADAGNGSEAAGGATPASPATSNAPSGAGEGAAGAREPSPTRGRAALSGSEVGVRPGSQAALDRIAARTGSRSTASPPRTGGPASGDWRAAVVGGGAQTTPSQHAGTTPAATAAGDSASGSNTSPSGEDPHADLLPSMEGAGAAEVARVTFADPLNSEGGSQA